MKHFLDTSILRTLTSSAKVTQDYYKKELTGEKYICSYVRMEFIRGFLIPCMEFHSTFSFPNIYSVQDALSRFKHNFSKGKLTALFEMIVGLLNQKRITFGDPNDLEHAKWIVGDYIRKIYIQIPKRYKDIGAYQSICKKLDYQLAFDPLNIEDSFLEFIEGFQNKANYQSCKVHLFLKSKQKDIDTLQENKDYRIKGVNRSGFRDILTALDKKPIDDITCQDCMKIGDMIIAIMAPAPMRLETLDKSFDYLMPILQKDHKRHDHETKIIRGDS